MHYTQAVDNSKTPVSNCRELEVENIQIIWLLGIIITIVNGTII